MVGMMNTACTPSHMQLLVRVLMVCIRIINVHQNACLHAADGEPRGWRGTLRTVMTVHHATPIQPMTMPILPCHSKLTLHQACADKAIPQDQCVQRALPGRRVQAGRPCG